MPKPLNGDIFCVTPTAVRGSAFLFIPIIFVLFSVTSSAQHLPKKIRDYKVHNEVITVTNQGSLGGNTNFIVETPKVSSISFGGLTLTVAGELEAAGYDGKVESLLFRDFRINDIPVQVAELNEPFTVKKDGKTSLPVPASVFLSATSLVTAAWKEMMESKDDWTVTGRVFVFGKFRKFGFNFKRVVAVDVRLTVKNPLAEYRKSNLS